MTTIEGQLEQDEKGRMVVRFPIKGTIILPQGMKKEDVVLEFPNYLSIKPDDDLINYK
jgi:hypothetical protein